MGEAIETVQQIAREEAPRGFAVDYAGASRQYVQEGSALLVTFGLALAIIFLVLAAQFESFRDPLVIMVTVPLSIKAVDMGTGNELWQLPIRNTAYLGPLPH